MLLHILEIIYLEILLKPENRCLSDKDIDKKINIMDKPLAFIFHQAI